MSNSDQPWRPRLRYICFIERAADVESAQPSDTEGGIHLLRGMPTVHVIGYRQGMRELTYNAPTLGDVTNDSNETGEPDDNQITARKRETEWITNGERLTKEETWEIIVRKGLKRSLLR